MLVNLNISAFFDKWMVDEVFILNGLDGMVICWMVNDNEQWAYVQVQIDEKAVLLCMLRWLLSSFMSSVIYVMIGFLWLIPMTWLIYESLLILYGLDSFGKIIDLLC